MKMKHVISFSLLSLSLDSFAIEAPSALPNQDDPKTRLYGVVQTVVNLVDSTRKNAPDFGIKKATLGYEGIYSRYGMGLEIGFVYYDANVTINSNGITIRRAEVFVDFLDHRLPSHKGGYNLKAYLGRHRPGSADGGDAAPDVASSPNGFDSMDGLFLESNFLFQKGFASITAGAANTMAFFDYSGNQLVKGL